MTVSEHRARLLWLPVLSRRRSLSWVARYQRETVAVDAACGLLAGLVALLGRFPGAPQPFLYVAVTAGLLNAEPFHIEKFKEWVEPRFAFPQLVHPAFSWPAGVPDPRPPCRA